VETLAMSFGKRAYNVQLFLEEVGKMLSSEPGRASVNTTTAYVGRRGGDSVEIRDKYGQFENVVYPGGREMLINIGEEALVRFGSYFLRVNPREGEILERWGS
jgi:hypothetical protein